MNRIPKLATAAAFGALGIAAVLAPFHDAANGGPGAQASAPELIATAVAAEPSDAAARGRYLIAIAGCNDCHTPGFAMNGGTTPEQAWLTGDPLGWQGPWGTTYAPNLRRTFVARDGPKARVPASDAYPLPSGDERRRPARDLPLCPLARSRGRSGPRERPARTGRARPGRRLPGAAVMAARPAKPRARSRRIGSRARTRRKRRPRFVL